jgi:hypothetical protein
MEKGLLNKYNPVKQLINGGKDNKKGKIIPVTGRGGP